jgi:transcription initiation factor TFIIIB Brf1 subunit/transcription initiation factor TFIIB
MVTDTQTMDMVCPSCGLVHEDGHLVALPDWNEPIPMAVRPGGKKVQILRYYKIPSEHGERVYRALRKEASSLNLPMPIINSANLLIRRTNFSFKGLNFNLVATSALYLAARQQGMSPSLRKYCKITGFSSGVIWRVARMIAKDNHIIIHPVDPIQVAMMCFQHTPVDRETVSLVRMMLLGMGDKLVGKGMSPRGVAAGAYYVACAVTGPGLRRDRAAEAFDISPTILRRTAPYYLQWLKEHGYNAEADRVQKRLEGRKRIPALP